MSEAWTLYKAVSCKRQTASKRIYKEVFKLSMLCASLLLIKVILVLKFYYFLKAFSLLSILKKVKS